MEPHGFPISFSHMSHGNIEIFQFPTAFLLFHSPKCYRLFTDNGLIDRISLYKAFGDIKQPVKNSFFLIFLQQHSTHRNQPVAGAKIRLIPPWNLQRIISFAGTVCPRIPRMNIFSRMPGVRLLNSLNQT